MEKSKYKKICDIIVKLSFILIIVGGIISNILAYIIRHDLTIDYSMIFITSLFLLAYIITEKLYKDKLKFIPDIYYYVTVIFAYFAVFLGSYLNFYEMINWWDTMLHFSSGILLGLVSIIIISLIITTFFGEIDNKKKLLIVSIIGMLASLSFAVFWEFYEYMIDLVFDWDMQRGLTIDDTAPLEGQLKPYIRPSGRFIDPALTDTMKDMALATAGALVAVTLAYWPLSKVISRNERIKKGK